MSRIIKCQVNNEYVLGSGVPIGAAGSHGDVVLQLQFNEMWDGLSIIATFRDAMNEHPAAVMLIPSMLVDGEVRTYEVPVPSETKAIAGRARLTLTGYSVTTVDGAPDVDSLTNTATAFFRVLESDSAILDDGSIKNPTFAQQAQAAINDAGKLIEEAQNKLVNIDEKLADFDEAEEERRAEEDRRYDAEIERQNAETERNAKVEEIKILVGNIDAALDNILAIQKSLIGGNE